MEEPSNTNKPNPKRWPNPYWIYLILLVMLGGYYILGSSSLPEITWKQFEQEMVANGDVAKVDVVNRERAEVYIRMERLAEPRHSKAPKYSFTDKPVEGPHYFFNIGSVEVFEGDLERAQSEIPREDRITVTYSSRENWFQDILTWIIPLMLFIFLWLFILGRGSSILRGSGSSIFSFGQTKARVFESGQKSTITFADVAGLEEAKEEISELVHFLKNPEEYKRLGAKIPKGVLLAGPPGSGKTLLAKAVAGEAGVPFFSLSGSEFVEMFVGVGAARMRDLFIKAKAKAPSIIFIDEIDTVGRARSGLHAFQANDERESTLNQLLAELDGFDTDTGVIVLAATNRGDILDPALLRPGRFDRHIHLELPSLKERQAIFEVHMKPLKLAKDLEVEILASQTPGFSGADIANICNEAALIAVRRKKKAVEKQDFMDAIDRVVAGLEKKSKIITDEEKKRIAYHEAGHVTAGWYLEHAQPVLKVSIIPRGRSLGAAWYLPEEHQIFTRSQLFDTICMALGGRAAEELIFGEVSSNALDDLEKATKQAMTMVVHYGLSSKLRNISYYDSTGRGEQALHKPYSEKTSEKIDAEVQQIIDDAYQKATDILKSHRSELDTLASELIRKEVVHQAEILRILGAQHVKPADHPGGLQ